MDIISAYREVGTYRGAAQVTGTTHKTVKRVIDRHEAGGGAPARLPRGHNYDAVAGLVAERVKKTAGRISAKRLLSAARAAGYSGSPRNFRRLVASAKQAWRAETTLAMLAECFEVLGGVPGTVQADRMGCLKGGVVANVVVPTPEYVRFASHLRVPA